MDKLTRTEAEWRTLLTPEQYHVLREAGTERPFTGRYWRTEEAGQYKCAGCGNLLFRSDAKFQSACGWPSFFETASPEAIEERPDNSHGMRRTEVLCGRCGGHLGHVFDDGPPPTHLRFCMNSAALELVSEGK